MASQLQACHVDETSCVRMVCTSRVPRANACQERVSCAFRYARRAFAVQHHGATALEILEAKDAPRGMHAYFRVILYVVLSSIQYGLSTAREHRRPGHFGRVVIAKRRSKWWSAWCTPPKFHQTIGQKNNQAFTLQQHPTVKGIWRHLKGLAHQHAAQTSS